MSLLSKPYFHSEKEAFIHLESVLWPSGPTCPHCGNAGKIYALEGVKTKPTKKHPEGIERFGLKKCAECRKQFTVRVKTVFESSHIPLHKWLQATYLLACSKKGMSSHQLHRVLEITYKSAWFMTHRIREAMKAGTLPPMGGFGKVVEADETYFGNKRHYRIKRGTGHKFAVFSLVERGGNVKSFHVDDVRAMHLKPILLANIDPQSTLMTDESRIYMEPGKRFRAHLSVNHGKEEYVRGDAYTNTVEGYFSIFKRGMKGVYQHCSERHLHRYLAEFDFRYNNRKVTDSERAGAALAGIRGKRLLYRDSSVG